MLLETFKNQPMDIKLKKIYSDSELTVSGTYTHSENRIELFKSLKNFTTYGYLEAQYIEFKDGTILSVSEENDVYKVIDFLDILKKHKSKEKPVIKGIKKPSSKEALIEFAKNNNVILKESDLEVLYDFSLMLGNEEDGDVSIDELIIIPKYELSVGLTMVQHGDSWNIFIDGYDLLKYKHNYNCSEVF